MGAMLGAVSKGRTSHPSSKWRRQTGSMQQEHGEWGNGSGVSSPEGTCDGGRGGCITDDIAVGPGAREGATWGLEASACLLARGVGEPVAGVERGRGARRDSGAERPQIQGSLRAAGATGERGAGPECQPGSHFNHFNWPLAVPG